MFSWLSCDKYTESASKALDNVEMTRFERWSYKFHHFICFSCRRFLRQIRSIESECSNIGEMGAEKLSEKQKNLLKDALKSELP